MYFRVEQVGTLNHCHLSLQPTSYTENSPPLFLRFEQKILEAHRSGASTSRQGFGRWQTEWPWNNGSIISTWTMGPPHLASGLGSRHETPLKRRGQPDPDRGRKLIIVTYQSWGNPPSSDTPTETKQVEWVRVYPLKIWPTDSPSCEICSSSNSWC